MNWADPWVDLFLQACDWTAGLQGSWLEASSAWSSASWVCTNHHLCLWVWTSGEIVVPLQVLLSEGDVVFCGLQLTQIQVACLPLIGQRGSRDLSCSGQGTMDSSCTRVGWKKTEFLTLSKVYSPVLSSVSMPGFVTSMLILKWAELHLFL